MSRGDDRSRPASAAGRFAPGPGEGGRFAGDRPRGRERRERDADSPAYQALQDIGRLRVVRADDLVQHLWRGEEGQAQRDLSRLQRQGLIRTKWVRRDDGTRYAVLTLSRSGRRRAQAAGQNGQRYYAGFGHSAQIGHDAALYRAYKDASARLDGSGRKVRRIVLDHELKGDYQRELARARGTRPEKQHQAAEKTGLQIVNGKAAMPDVRLEYETAEGERGFVDLEVTTDDYRASQIAEKGKAGFALYAAGSDSSSGASVQDGPELLDELLAL